MNESPSHYGRGIFYVFSDLSGQFVDAFEYAFCRTV